MKKLQLISCLLAVALTCVSCGGEAAYAETSAALVETTEHTETTSSTTQYLDTLPKRDLNGWVFHVIGQSTLTRQNFYMEEKDGDTINDAIYKRDEQVCERLNIKIEYNALDDRNQVASKVQNTVLADEAAYEMAITAMSSGINTMVSAGVLYDLNEMPYLSIDGGLWDASIHNNMQFLGRQYFTTGVISPQYCQSPVACLFNKRLVDEYKLGNIYDTVLDGKWTIDFMNECMKGAARDLDGNSVMDVNDFYGFALDGVFGNVLYTSAGCNPITVENGVYTVNLADEHILDVIAKCASIFGNPEITYHNTQSDGSSLVVFREGRSIFVTCDMLDIQKFRDMQDDFGIIPTPKYDEAQESYITSCTTWLPTGVAVPLNCADTENTGLVMETMAAVSEQLIIPAVYEVTLQGKVTRDDVSSQMLDIIFENPSYDFITAFDFGGSGTAIRRAVLGWDENWASKWAGIEKTVNNEVNSVMENATKES